MRIASSHDTGEGTQRPERRAGVQGGAARGPIPGGRCAVCKVQKKGRCGSAAAHRNCLRRTSAGAEGGALPGALPRGTLGQNPPRGRRGSPAAESGPGSEADPAAESGPGSEADPAQDANRAAAEGGYLKDNPGPDEDEHLGGVAENIDCGATGDMADWDDALDECTAMGTPAKRACLEAGAAADACAEPLETVQVVA